MMVCVDENKILHSFDDRSALNHDQEKTDSKISIRLL